MNDCVPVIANKAAAQARHVERGYRTSNRTVMEGELAMLFVLPKLLSLSVPLLTMVGPL